LISFGFQILAVLFKIEKDKLMAIPAGIEPATAP